MVTFTEPMLLTAQSRAMGMPLFLYMWRVHASDHNELVCVCESPTNKQIAGQRAEVLVYRLQNSAKVQVTVHRWQSIKLEGTSRFMNQVLLKFHEGKDKPYPLPLLIRLQRKVTMTGTS